MKQKLDDVVAWFRPPYLDSEEHTVQYRRAETLIKVHLFLITSVVLMFIFTFTIAPENKNVPLHWALITLISSLVLLKTTRSLVFTGNFLAAGWFAILVPAILQSGGLYSDNMLWLALAPAIAVLFAARKWGFFWASVLFLFSIGLFFYHLYDDTSFKALLLQFSPEYYFLSFTLFFAVLLGLVYIFERGQELIIDALQKQKKLLQEQQMQISRQMDELREAHRKIEEINGQLEQFAYAASHDLKEPLRMIGMYTQLIERQLQAYLNDDTKEFMHYVRNGVARMQRMLDDLLQYSRTGRHSDIQDNDLNELLFIVLNNLTVAMQESNASISTNLLPIVRASTTELVQLFQNLLANAIKFRKPNAPPQISITATDEGTHFLFTVKDNGIGIPTDQQDRVFRIFERLHNHSDYDGSGIGLATVRKIVTNLGGKIWLQSTEGIGTTFYFTIPTQHIVSHYLHSNSNKVATA